MNRRILLARRPQGLAVREDFESEQRPIPAIGDGQALLKTLYVGIDPTIRTWLSTAKSYLPPVQIGEVVRSAGAGRIVQSNNARFREGDIVTALTGWQEYSVLDDNSFSTCFAASTNPRHALGVLGSTGVAAHVGLLTIGRPQEGETVVVSAAAGATGSLVGQIAKLKGCRAVGIAGNEEKCRHVVDDLGFDACVNYKSGELSHALKGSCPDGVDIYFDNVGGPVLNAVLGRLAMGGRVALCGAISVYNAERRPSGPANYLNLITVRGRMEGFNGMDHWSRHAEIAQDFETWMREGKVVVRETIVDGLQEAWRSVNMLFTGENIGKLLVKVGSGTG